MGSERYCDNGCTRVSLNLGSDAFVMLASNSPSMGEYVCAWRAATAEQ